MPNQQHMNHLKRGVRHWNEWRKKHLGMLLNLSRADLIYAGLREANLSDADLSEARLDRANLIHANLSKADLSGANLGEADLREAFLEATDLSRANLIDADLSDANLREANLSGADLRGAILWRAHLIDADLSGARLSEADLGWALLGDADLSDADLSGASLGGADLSGARLSRANLWRADLRGANLSTARLREADLSEASLGGADLSGADLSGADLSEAYLRGADLSGVNLRGANLNSVVLRETIFARIDLSIVKGLETIRHLGPSTVDVKSVVLPQGQALITFLQGAGFSDTFIDYLPSLSQDALQYYSVFISYSTNDEDFARCLYVDLQKHGVRCWFAPHNMKIGDKIRSRIDESIYLHDKLLLVLSRSSVQSTWVEKEVETAFDKERTHTCLVLFPIKLDDIIMHMTTGWAGDIRRMRHIGDFRGWKDHDTYQKAFDRLLRDLRAEPQGKKPREGTPNSRKS